MSDDFFSFDEALDELRLKEEELKRLVSEGEIRAFRKGDTMKLRRSDVESLRAELSGGEVVDLGEATEELVFEDDDAFDDSGMATQEIADVDTLIDDVEDVGEIELEEEEETEGVGMLALILVTSAVMVLAMPVVFSISMGQVSDLSKSVAEMCGFTLP